MAESAFISSPIRYSGQGKVLIAPYNSGSPFAWRPLGRCPSVELQPKITPYEEMDVEEGLRQTSIRMIESATLDGSFTLEHYSQHNLALRFFGETSAIGAGTVSAESVAGTVAVDDVIYSAKPEISSLVITDSAGSPATLTEGTHYEILDAHRGKIRILSLGSFTQPFKLAYSNAAAVQLPVMTETTFPEYSLKFEGVNTFNSGLIDVVLFRVQIEPKNAMRLIQEKGVESADLTFTCLADLTKSAGGTLGRYGKIIVR